MIYFKVVMSNKEGNIIIGEDELPKLIEAVSKKSSAVFRQGILLNPNMAVSVVVAEEMMGEIRGAEKYGKKYIEKQSRFASLLSGKMKMLSDKARTEIQEQDR